MNGPHQGCVRTDWNLTYSHQLPVSGEENTGKENVIFSEAESILLHIFSSLKNKTTLVFFKSRHCIRRPCFAC